jgi:YegS/Rv2252/BmrU family lipid kinase
MNKEIVIINKNVNGADNAIKFFSNKKDILFTDDNNDLSKKLKEKISKGFDSFIICGGDGTINHFINSYMKLTENSRKNLKIGIIPCGRANDLARKLKIPFDINKAYEIIKNDKPIKIDLIQVNEKFFITGGGFGLPAEVIKDVNKHSKKTSNKLLRDLIYYLSVLKKVFINYSGAKIKGINQKLMFFAVCNQNFIGKRFLLSPDSINDDGFFEICNIPKPKNPISGFSVVQKVIKGKHICLKGCITKKVKSLEIQLEQKNWFMADGELLDFNDEFKFKIIPKSISIFH